MLYASDLISQYLPWYYITAQYLKNFQLPHWVSFAQDGVYPLLAEGETGVLSPINSLILYLFPFSVSVNLLYLIYFALAILGMYLFLRVNQLSKLSSIFGALVFALSGYMISRYFQPSIIFTAALVPLGFAFIQKSQTVNNKVPFLLAPLIYLQITAGHLQIALISIAGYLTFFLLLTFLNKKPLVPSLVKILVIVGLGICLSAPQLLPSFKLFALSERSHWDPMIRFAYSLPPSHLITYIRPYAFGISTPGDDLGFTQIGGGFWELNLTIWTLPFFLSLIPLFIIAKNRRQSKVDKTIISLYIIWLFFLLLSFGGYFKLYRVIAHINYFPFRAPSRFLLISTFAASTLAAFGFEIITKRLKKSVRVAAFFIILISILLQQKLLLTKYIITKPSSQVVANVRQSSKYQLTTPLKLDSEKIDNLEEPPKVFVKEFQIGLLFSLIGILLLYFWYRKSRKHP
ncbi:hypothetical protein A3B51_02415 [Candidatus Curtissbacteria bacterium RIFCSPLOWO2_01_FULL_41_18]|uniref:Membrane protein 6-pyruvoyl-tetrahydropterin synthase-related domain-containing protein n=1 Tax=Candidatus Curtissbacteria bacterium RIFCSPLOWO2_01_FULL_41_18 TaxID=1797727 RepID=A0A1F5HL76_9BACT|nr:MAG: hypothetical protein A3B51_02415 [Candidatus Curtissbacteria bacterium RIFCSPLOWO2_01_FULL_41_18]